MERLLLLIFFILSFSMGYADNDCNGGDKEPPRRKQSEPHLAASGSIPFFRSRDPNEVIGPNGYDSVRWVSANDVLSYTILFENDPELATAAAQRVDIRFDFTNKAWMRGFGICDYSFSNMSFPVAKPSNAYQQRIDLKDSLGYFVDLIAGLDVARLQGFWTFTTIDPETGYAPWQAEMGMLPVNDSTHVGEGFVTFQLKPYEGVKTGDTISIQASIVFDTNDTIPTNRWCNKIDAGIPSSKLIAEPHPSLPDNFNLKFSGKDDENGSGIRHILLYLANNNGLYEEIDTCAVDSILVFPVEKGRHYKLYSIAVDNAGNREPAKLEPDVILNFNTAPSDLMLSDSIFQDDLETGGFVGRLYTEDPDEGNTFTYAMAEGDGAIHNDLFQITGDLLQIQESFMCAEDSVYSIRISTTDDGGLSFSKAFVLHLDHVLEKPKPDTLIVNICEGEFYLFHGVEYGQTGIYRYSKGNEFGCDSIYVLNLTVLPKLEGPLVTIEGMYTLVSSAAKGNQWFKADGTPIEGATEQEFTPEEDGIYYVAVSNGNCYSEPSQFYEVRISDYIDLQIDLKQGWNWISSNLSEPVHQDAKQFLQPIEDITERFVGQVDELINDPVYGLTGSLTSIDPTDSYKLKVSEDSDHIWSGNGCKPESMPITLHRGWNWIGYVPVRSNDLNEALSGIIPSENDVIKYIDDFAIYSDGRWVGTLTQLTPGEGYLYYASNATTFNYPSTRVFPVSNSANAKGAMSYSRPWDYNAHGYPDNTTLIGQLYANGVQTLEGTYTVGAFCGDECRGIGKYMDNILFIVIHGTIANNESINFRAYENATGKEYSINESIVFKGQQEGTFNAPYRLNVSLESSSIGEVSKGKYTIYPRPLRSRLYVSGETADIKTIQILSSDGVMMLQHAGYTSSGVDVSGLFPGVYVVAITQNNGMIYYEKVIKAQN